LRGFPSAGDVLVAGKYFHFRKREGALLSGQLHSHKAACRGGGVRRRVRSIVGQAFKQWHDS